MQKRRFLFPPRQEMHFFVNILLQNVRESRYSVWLLNLNLSFNSFKEEKKNHEHRWPQFVVANAAHVENGGVFNLLQKTGGIKYSWNKMTRNNSIAEWAILVFFSVEYLRVLKE